MNAPILLRPAPPATVQPDPDTHALIDALLAARNHITRGEGDAAAVIAWINLALARNGVTTYDPSVVMAAVAGTAARVLAHD